jgi:flagellar biosynthesis/type III secretory pathway protein FliH
MNNENKEFYMKGRMEGYMDGYNATMEKAMEKFDKPYLDVNDIMERYGVGINKAHQILRGIRSVCGGGKLDSNGRVLVAEVKYWESLVDTRYVERL